MDTVVIWGCGPVGQMAIRSADEGFASAKSEAGQR
jgi:threonine dehydrogenase-like Zn-dependent dehydrogenase